MGFPAFEQTIYRPSINQVIEPRLSVVLAPADQYAPGGALAKTGQAAAIRIAAPAIALVFVLGGLLWHGCGLMAYAARLILGGWSGRRRCLVLVLGVLGLCILGTRSPIVRTQGFSHLQDQIADRAGPGWLATQGMVELLGLAYPWGELLRQTVLGRLDFGLDPFAAAKSDQQATLDGLLP